MLNMDFTFSDIDNSMTEISKLTVSDKEIIYKHLDFITISEDNCLLLGASNLNGRYWFGDIYYYANANNALDTHNYTAKLNYGTGISDGLFLDKQGTIVVGDDFGSVSIYNIAQEEVGSDYVFYPKFQHTKHNDIVNSISASSSRNKVISGSMDCNIKVWSVNSSMQIEHSYDSAHTDSVTCVSFTPDDDNMFVSTSLDGYTLLWDVRKETPAEVLAKKDIGFNAVTWISSNNAIIGTNDGVILKVDTRILGKELTAGKYFDRPIYRFSTNPKFNRCVAVCADFNTVKVLDCTGENYTSIHTDNRHTDFVRGLAWSNGNNEKLCLFSSGWDGQILQHTITKKF